MTARIRRVISVMRPSIGSVRRRMTLQIEDLHNALPNRLALKCLFHWHALDMRSVRSMQTADYVSQFLQVRHDAASTRSATLQKSRSMPAAIAGVQRREFCRSIKL
jgi:hypothetical protein